MMPPLHQMLVSSTNFGCSMFMLFSFSRYILELNHSEGIHDLGAIKWDMALCLLVVYLICYFSLWKGISTSGKVSLLPFPTIHFDAPDETLFFFLFFFFYCRIGRVVYSIISIRRFIYSVDTRHYVTRLGRRH